MKAYSHELFLSYVDKINENNYSYGNDILYRMCKNMNVIPKDENDTVTVRKFADAIWLIGRSYAASPERGSGYVGNDGLGGFFYDLAEEIVKKKNYNDLRAKLYTLRGQKYRFDVLEEDLDLVYESALCVAMLNDMIKNSTNKKERDAISFSSKFLHFIAPDIFFIKDSYSLTGGISLFNGSRCFKVGKEPDWIDMDSDDVRTLFKNKIPSTKSILQRVASLKIYDANVCTGKLCKSDANKRDYLMHALRAYYTAEYLHRNGKECAQQIDGDPDSKYMPRLVDSVLMRIKE